MKSLTQHINESINERNLDESWSEREAGNASFHNELNKSYSGGKSTTSTKGFKNDAAMKKALKNSEAEKFILSSFVQGKITDITYRKYGTVYYSNYWLRRDSKLLEKLYLLLDKIVENNDEISSYEVDIDNDEDTSLGTISIFFK